MNPAEQEIASLRESCRIKCPECAEGRRHKNPTLSVTVNASETLYKCHHCDFQGIISSEPNQQPIRPTDFIGTNYVAEIKQKKVTPIPTKLNHDTDATEEFFASRGISIPDLSVLPPLTTDEKYFHDIGAKTKAVGFVYGDKKQPDAIKWRPVDGRKAFTQDGAAREFYGINQLDPESKTIIIVEGEADVIALASIGIKSVSCPNGAPMKVSNHRIDPEEDKKFSYVWEARDELEAADKIILAVDQDEAGEALAEELARRIGRAKCWRVKFPEGSKDPNDLIVNGGKEAMITALNESEPMPLAGVYGAKDYAAELFDVYRNGHGKGESTGLAVIDDLFTVTSGLYIVTGLPCSGKSEFIDQIMVNLSLSRSWKWAVASFENPPHIHLMKMAEKIVGKPAMDGVTPKMSQTELEEALRFLDEHYVFLENKDGNLATIESIIDRCKQAVMRLGVRGLVIDPYNYIAQTGDENEHQYISTMLSKMTTFAQAYDIAVFFVAHPMKMYPKEDGTYPIPKGMHISGSAAWFAKADVGITVHRGEVGVEIHSWKVRFKWIGKIGKTLLGYDVPTGRYFEGNENDRKAAFAPDKLKKSRAAHWQDDDWDDLEF